MISVIISIYNRLDNLYLILLGLQEQSFTDFEVIVSEDNNSTEAVEFLNKVRTEFKFVIKHVSQEDIGFRKTKILNKAILIADGEYLVFLDGDCVPHRKHLESYAKHLAPNVACVGRRCYLKKSFTDKLLANRDLSNVTIFNLLKHARHLDHAFYLPKFKLGNSSRLISGCNWGVHKKSLLDINGFDEDYMKPGVGEDHDVDWRLRKNGVNFLNIKRKAVVYHLFHKPNYDQSTLDFVNAQEQEKKILGFIACKNGINKLD